MADHDDYRERLTTLMEGLLGLYAYMQALFEELPLPVIAPDFTPVNGEDGPVQALLSLNRVRQLIEDEPISDMRKRAFEHMVLDWFTAYELLVITKMAGAAPWRLDAAEFALNRVLTWIEVIEEDDPEDES
ncbi:MULTISPECIES: hypothetical protein [unclassified Streptomyces]|uniref:hypothetical protein n=1 Tax=unclassified Streptomyces TaxID=2593676 RepID=UPI00190C2C29|nr:MULTISPECIES: hypothetical protein [unclassified Streptomyces]MBK3563208.1 hypothetical protein [Streptomyces sp. MBT62]MBK6013197.1 hypothetical protein [Streptomyces sp. MBT53]